MTRLTGLILSGLLGAGCSVEGDFSWVTHTWTTPDGVFALDHVSRHKVDVSVAIRRTYLGATYYFESEDNAYVFDSRPWSFLYSDNVHAQGRPDRTDQN